ncbi:hypothetical protein QQS21_012036 [Conoideocrella luteorostrata]|uniref:AB hydrolase-1 domain-containing protein n=1 Tax=Conoideocrella luteorostrata TaxID=1105319 RepID=A0AAJ0CE99_9HYPO|nr:hypothetical protein QQS21_012036 [Conoideocrella luteorostrata]
MALKKVETATLEISFYEHGPAIGWPVILSHGFPYDVHAYDRVAPKLAAAGARVIVPYLRGFGPTRFLSASTMRSGQQAVLGSDIIDLMDALNIKKAILAGFDWGGLASCVAAVLWPERVNGLVSYAGYDVVDRQEQRKANNPALECVMWYQHLFQHERGRDCLSRHRRDLCRKLWQQWSPTWASCDAEFEHAATTLDNPDFVDVVIHCYRHVFGTEEGDPALQHLEDRLAQRPKVTVPSVTLDGTKDPLKPGGSSSHAAMFVGPHERWEFDVGHAFPLENPEAFAEAVLTVQQWQSGRN